MDRTSRYINKMSESRLAGQAAMVNTQKEISEAPYRDYFAEALAFIWCVITHYTFRFAASVVGFVTVLLFTLGVVGGVELEILPVACGIPLGIMLLCILGLINKARK